jgi:hypothetical protein
MAIILVGMAFWLPQPVIDLIRGAAQVVALE